MNAPAHALADQDDDEVIADEFGIRAVLRSSIGKRTSISKNGMASHAHPSFARWLLE